MADLSDVSNSLGALLGNTLYPTTPPTGIIQASPVVGIPVQVEVGWPNANDLADAKSSGKIIVSIYPRPTERNTTRYPRTAGQNGALQTATFTLTQSGQVITVAGAQPTTYFPHNFAVFVDRIAYLYQAAPTDTPASIAAAIAAEIPGATVAGAQITIASPSIIGDLRVGTQAPTSQEVKRQEREWQIIVWAPTPTTRDKVAAPLDVVIGQTQFLTFSDGSKGRLLYKGSPFTDFDQKAGLFRRDLIVSVEYATLAIGIATEVVAIELQVWLNGSKQALATETGSEIDTENSVVIATADPDITTYT